MQATIVRTSDFTGANEKVVEISNLEELLNFMMEAGEPIIISFQISEGWFKDKSVQKYDETKLQIEVYDDYRE